MKSGNLNFLEASGPQQACNGTDLLFFLLRNKFIVHGIKTDIIIIPETPPMTAPNNYTLRRPVYFTLHTDSLL